MIRHRIYLIKFLGFFAGCFFCCYFQRTFHLSPALSAALVGFLGTFVHFPSLVERNGIQAVIYAGSFAGMSSLQNLPTSEHILGISIIGTTVYFLAKPHFTGFGGKLGVIALISTLCMIFGKTLW